MAIAAAVPQLMVNAGNSMSTSNLPTATTSQSSASTMDKLSSTASQENLINVESTVMSSSTSRIVSTAYYDESGFKEDSTGKKIKFPIESYQGLEKATAERVRRFVDETKANLLRGRLESSPNLSSSRTTSGKKILTFKKKNDLVSKLVKCGKLFRNWYNLCPEWPQTNFNKSCDFLIRWAGPSPG